MARKRESGSTSRGTLDAAKKQSQAKRVATGTGSRPISEKEKRIMAGLKVKPV